MLPGDRSARPSGRRDCRGGEAHRGRVHRASTGWTRLAGSGQEQERVAGERGLHSAAGLQCVHCAGRNVLRIQLPLCIHGLFELPLLCRCLQRALLSGLDTRTSPKEYPVQSLILRRQDYSCARRKERRDHDVFAIYRAKPDSQDSICSRYIDIYRSRYHAINVVRQCYFSWKCKVNYLFIWWFHHRKRKTFHFARDLIQRI